MNDLKKFLGLFPGQGSQKVGMGQSLWASTEIAKEYFELADKTLGFKLSKICFSGPAENLTSTDIAQPAILTVSVICYEIAKTSPQKISLLAAAGHSLGEYSALVAAQSLTFEDAVMLVNKRGRYMQEAVAKGAGLMVAVLGKDLVEIETAISAVKEGIVQAANINAPGQVVVAGDVVGINAFKVALNGGKIIPLEVSAPFHCALMKPAADSLAKDLDALTIRPCIFPVYANFSAKPVIDPNQIRQNLKDQVCGRVRWVECMENAIRDHTPELALEFGEGKVLTGLLKKINKELLSINIDSKEKLLEIK
ncbi:MAG: ACP S-malonyltransferase [bacterium]|nr:ACP S-malonyltransferase [bacterium]